MTRHFGELFAAQQSKRNFVCVGLDTDCANISAQIQHILQPPELIMGGFTKPRLQYLYNCRLVDAIREVGVYKPNVAFYECHGSEGLDALRRTIEYINKVAPDVPVIADFKRADIGNTNHGSVQLAFDYLKADAVTLNPYLGGEALQPFLTREDKGFFILCRTSNPGAGEFQDLPVRPPQWTPRLDELFAPKAELPLYQFVAYRVAEHWNTHGNCGLVVGATAPAELVQVRRIAGDLPILVPGVGAQGGMVEDVVPVAKNSLGQGFTINSSRGIIFASPAADFAETAQQKVIELNTQIRTFLA